MPYNLFDKWYKDTRKKLIPVQAFGTPPTDVVSKAASAPALDQNPTCASEYRTSYLGGYPYEQRCACQSEEFGLCGFEESGRETEGFMLNITGLNRFFFVCNFHDMRCKYDKVLSIIHQQLNCEPEDGDVFIVMSKDYV